jgi:DUF1365 family protein
MCDVQLCFGNVHHTRLRPVRNSFNYGVYFLRLPLRSIGDAAPPTKLFSRNRFNLLSFHDKDHGDGKRPLLEWIDDLLKQHGIEDADGEVWLQTFPRVFGYVFNPVSFWFCHRSDGRLRAVLCDVCNTFGERHYYLLDQGGPIFINTELTAAKVFHVSPFCRVDGKYRFRFMRTGAKRDQAFTERTLARIDYDDTDGPVLLTSITGDSNQLNDRSILQGLFRFPLMTFAVIARIHWQALKLWIKRVPFFHKPSPPQEELSK